MIYIETIITSLIFSLIWSLLASLVLFTFERGGLFDFVREWLICKIMDFEPMMLRNYLGRYMDFQGSEEMEDYYNTALDKLTMDSKLVKLLVCQVCFTVNTGLWASLGLGFVLFSGVNVALFVVCGLAFNYWLSKKV